MIYAYPQEVHDFVRDNCTKMRDDDLAERCNELFGTEFTKYKMRAFRANHGYKNGMPKKYSREEYLQRQTKYPKGMYEFIRDNSWGTSTKEMIGMVREKFGFEMTTGQMKAYRRRYGIRSGETGWFQKGHTPGNKGKRIDEYMSPEAAAKVRSTAFRKGHVPANELPIGTEVINVFSKGYRIRKVSMTGKRYEKWKFVHRLVWEEHHGPIPEGACIAFRDGDRTNCSIENLMMITKAELIMMAKKGYFSECPEATDAGLKLVRIQARVRERRKGK